ncbi:hypothetical protein PINS_up010494 [Pythium insidiosum]|nr:hypothetical protein PINS_up010494 [Pythium insidiosum]
MASHAMTTTTSARRVGIKHQDWTRDAAARRHAVMQLQRQARRDLTALARRLATASSDEVAAGDEETDTDDAVAMEDVTTGSARSKLKTREERIKRRRAHFAQQLLVPEWMVDVPSDLNGKGSQIGAGWYVVPRPEGKRCLVVASHGLTIARTQAGSVFKRFPSALPNGSRKTNGSGDAYCILDCIFHEYDKTFYVLDVMCWKGYLLYNCTTEFRWFWLRDKLSEGTSATASTANPFRFLPLPCYECDEQGVIDAYTTPFPFLKDGLLFYMKSAHYDLGLTPLVLVWKDAKCSRFHVYTEKPTIVLQLDADNKFTTLEGIALWTPDPAFLQANELTTGDLAKFSFDEGYFTSDQTPHLMGLTFLQRSSPQRALPDSWTKILFQYNARSGGTRFETILEAARVPQDDGVTSSMDM